MFSTGEVISYQARCAEEDASLQRGMNFHLNDEHSVILMSRRGNAPDHDRIEDGGQILVYEGHDVPRSPGRANPKNVDQPSLYPSGKPTQNGRFSEAAEAYKTDSREAEAVRVYEKIHSGVWVYNELFALVDSWKERSADTNVFKFKLRLLDSDERGGVVERHRQVPGIPSTIVSSRLR